MAKQDEAGAGPPPDTLTQRIGVLTRREVEARILAPVVDALADRFGREEVIEIVAATVVKIAQQQGSELAASMGGTTSIEFLDSLEYWTRDDALQIDVLRHDDATLDFNVTRCRYAEMYKALGIPELGALFSCNRDYALIDGFNEDATLTRTQTIMEGAAYCDFRYEFPTNPPNDSATSEFYPPEAVVPTELRTNKLYLRPLRTSDVELDYAAVMASREQLNLWSNTSWPAHNFTLEENLADLKDHEEEHESRVAFTYTVLDPAAERCLGCVYLTPLTQQARDFCTDGEYGANVSFWIRSDDLRSDLESHLLATLRSWLKDAWSFDCVFFIVAVENERQATLLRNAGLRYRGHVPLRSGSICSAFEFVE